MTRLQYWVVGGEYSAVDFRAMVPGTEQTIGPFADRDSALAAWRNVSERYRHRCLMRFAVASEVQRTTAA